MNKKYIIYVTIPKVEIISCYIIKCNLFRTLYLIEIITIIIVYVYRHTFFPFLKLKYLNRKFCSMYDIMTKQGCDIMAISKTGLKKKIIISLF